MFKKIFTGLLLGAAAMSFGQMENMPQTDYMPLIFLNPAVAKDMHLSSEVASKENSVIMQDGMAMMPYVADAKKGKTSGVIKAYQKMSDDSLAPLSASQRIRYRQLSLQYYGPVALKLPKYQTALGLSATQKRKIDAVINSTSASMASHLRGVQSGDMAGSIGTVKTYQTKTRAAQEAAVNAILTPAQKAKWNAMQGKKLPGISDILGGLGM